MRAVGVNRSGGGARLGLLTCGVLLQAWALLALVQAPGHDLPRHVALMLFACMCWVVALRLVIGLPEGASRRADLALIFGIAVAMRLALVLAPPSLSDDVYRAVWDARLMHAGVNPYAFAPGAPELEPYRDEVIWPRVNHPEQRTPYPPLAEMLSAAAYAVAPERLMAMQVMAAAADLLCAALLAWLLARCGSDPRRCLAVAWSPIGALHFAHGGHNDAVMVAAVLAGTLLLSFDRRWLAMAALGVGTTVKVIPAFFLPAFARATGIVPGLAWAAVCVLLTLPLIGAAPGFALGMLQEAGDAQFNDSIHLVFERIARTVAPVGASAIASAVGLLIVGMAGIISWIRGDGTARSALVDGSRVVAVYILVAAVVEPWYFTWLAPLIAFQLQAAAGRPWFRLNDAPAWLWLSCAANLTDLTYLPGGSGLWLGIRLVEYLPAYCLLALAMVQGWRDSGANTSPESQDRDPARGLA